MPGEKPPKAAGEGIGHETRNVVRTAGSGIKRLTLFFALVGLALMAPWRPLGAMAYGDGAGIGYVAKIEGAPAEPPEIERLLKEVSQTFQEEKDLPASMALLKRRAGEDLPEMEKVLRSFGYFRGKSLFIVAAAEPDDVLETFDVQGAPDAARSSQKGIKIQFRIDPGPRFIFWRPTISLVPAAGLDALSPPTPTEAGILEDAPYTAGQVVGAENFILAHYQTHGYPFAAIDREVTADFAVNRVQVTFLVNPGPHALFGDILITGLERLDPAYVREQLPWKEGQPYDSRLIDKARRALFDSNLFGMVDFENPGHVDDQGRLPITIRLKERTPRTVRLGLEYTTDYGPGVNGGWTHRNLFGMAEELSTGALFNSKIRTAFARFDRPMFMDRDNTLIADGSLNDETTDAYNARSVDISTVLKRRFTQNFSAGMGSGFRYGRVEQKDDRAKTSYRLAYLPITATQDTRTDLMNPMDGYELSLVMAPYQDVEDGATRFFRYLVSGSAYYDFSSGGKAVLAVRAAFGQVFGISREQMPADLRFYAGGGGSVRGYAYQLAGPVLGNVPSGGLSVLTFSVEMRLKITETVGLVPFLDGGTAFSDRVPDLDDQKILYGAGLGLRYFTAIGPIRLDVAVPLNRRHGLDDRFQFYVSIGQAF